MDQNNQSASRRIVISAAGALLLALWPSFAADAQKADLSAFDRELREYVERVSPSVVGIQFVTYDTQPLEGDPATSLVRRIRLSVSGMIRNQEGLVVTLLPGGTPPVHEHADVQIDVELADGKRCGAHWVAGDAESGISLLQLDSAPATLQPMNTSGGFPPKLGDHVVALGHGKSSVSLGSVLDVNARAQCNGYTFPRAIRAKVAVTRQDIGGMLADGSGRVVGMLAYAPPEVLTPTMVDPETLKQETAAAIPLDLMERISDQLEERGRVLRGSIGGGCVFLNKESMQKMGLGNVGAYVQVIDPEGVGAANGLQVGDVITNVDHRQLRSFADLYWFRERIEYGDIGSTVRLEVYRSTKNKKSFEVISLPIGIRQAEMPANRASTVPAKK